MNIHMFCLTVAVTLNKGLSCQGKASPHGIQKGPSPIYCGNNKTG